MLAKMCDDLSLTWPLVVLMVYVKMTGAKELLIIIIINMICE